MSPINPADLSCAVDEVERKTINSTWDGLRKIAQNEGPKTLWRGLSPTLVMSVPANVIYFAGYDWLRTAQASPVRQKIHDAYTNAGSQPHSYGCWPLPRNNGWIARHGSKPRILQSVERPHLDPLA
jgi:hypothetical protein